MIRLLLLAALTCLFLGCQTDPEDADFYYKGWKNPQQGADQRIYGPHGGYVPPE